MQSKYYKAIIYMILSTLSFSIMQLIVKISASTIPVMQQVFARNAVILIITIVAIIKLKENIIPNKKVIIPLLLRSIFGYLGVISFFYATKTMNLADASLIQKTSPFWTTFLGFLILKEKVLKIQWIAIIIAIIGSIFVIKPELNSNFFQISVALGSAIFAALAYTMIGHLKGKVSGSIIIFYFSLLSTVFSSFFIMTFKIPNIYELIMLILIGIFAGFGQFFLTKSYTQAPISTVSIYSEFGIVFSYLFGLFILNEIIDLYSIIGILLVIIASILPHIYKKDPQ